MSMEDIKNFVLQGYRNILDREPRPRELGHYTNEISLGKMKKEKLLEILETSRVYAGTTEKPYSGNILETTRTYVETIEKPDSGNILKVSNIDPMEDIRNSVTQGYRDILKREPDPGGFEYYTNEISLGKITRDRFLEVLKTSEEYISLGKITKDPMEDIKNFVTQGYRDILKREPDPGGFEHYTNEISLGKITKERFLEILRTSEEYRNRFG